MNKAKENIIEEVIQIGRVVLDDEGRAKLDKVSRLIDEYLVAVLPTAAGGSAHNSSHEGQWFAKGWDACLERIKCNAEV